MWAPGVPCTTRWLEFRSRKGVHSLPCLGGLGAHIWGDLPAHWRSSAPALPASVIIDYASTVSIPSSSIVPCITVQMRSPWPNWEACSGVGTLLRQDRGFWSEMACNTF